jgi:uncharacterized membrane protein YhaH (DUF805 family)
MQWYIGVFKKFAQFAGRARRKEFWMFTLFNIIVGIVIGIVESALGLATTSSSNGTMSFNGGPISVIYSLAALIPSVAVAVRRMHDIGKSGWMLLLGIIPLVGLIVIYWLAKDGDPQTNAFGPNPKMDMISA